jgi:acyl dehydratase
MMAVFDKSFIGAEMQEFPIAVGKDMIRKFAAAISETNPVYYDEAAAHAAGHPGLLAPPSFGFTIHLLHPQPFDFPKMGLEPSRMLHAEQTFIYSAPIFAGDVIRIRTRITDLREKKGGALEFISMRTFGRNQRNDAVFEMVAVLVSRNTG